MDVHAELRFGELSVAIVGAPAAAARGGGARRAAWSDTLVVAARSTRVVFNSEHRARSGWVTHAGERGFDGAATLGALHVAIQRTSTTSATTTTTTSELVLVRSTGARAEAAGNGADTVRECLLFTVTLYANRAHSLTRSP